MVHEPPGAVLSAAAQPQVRLNRGLDFVALDDALVDLRLPPEALEVPVPRCLLEHREPELQQRAALLSRIAAQFAHAAARSAAPAEGPGSEPGPGGALALEDALEVIAANERGRQGRARFAALRAARSARQLEERRKESGTVRALVPHSETVPRPHMRPVAANTERPARCGRTGAVSTGQRSCSCFPFD